MLRAVMFVLVVSMAGCGFVAYSTAPAIVGSGVPLSEERPVSGIKSIRLQNVGTLTLKQGSSESLTVKGDDNIVPRMESALKDGVLTLKLIDGSVTTKTPMEYIVEVKDLDALEVVGASKCNASGLSLKKLTLKVVGASQVTLAGTCADLVADATGASQIHATDLKCKTVQVAVTGACNAAVHAEEKLDAAATGASKVTYSGAAQVTQRVAGASSVKKK